MPSHIQPQNRNIIFRIYSKPKKSCILHSFMYIVSAKFKTFFMALDALQQSKSGPRPKKVGNHWSIPKHSSLFTHYKTIPWRQRKSSCLFIHNKNICSASSRLLLIISKRLAYPDCFNELFSIIICRHHHESKHCLLESVAQLAW